MSNLINSFANKGLEQLVSLAPRHVVGAIKDAAAETGVNFAYLLQQARAESSFNPEAKAKTSSASGLFQFIESTWTNMVEKYGEKYGIDPNASKAEILNLRNDPEIASKMAAEFANENKSFLDRKWGGDVGSTELYFAHFMGAGGAAAFLNARDENPAAQAAIIFPKAAAANKNVFYDKATGRAKTLDEVYAFFDKKFQIDDAQPEAITQLAEATTEKVDSPLPSLKPEQENQSQTARYNPPPAIKMINHTNSLIPPSYQSIFANPIDIMMLTQLSLPGQENGSNKGL
jgi:hypothetical protein